MVVHGCMLNLGMVWCKYELQTNMALSVEHFLQYTLKYPKIFAEKKCNPPFKVKNTSTPHGGRKKPSTSSNCHLPMHIK